MKTQSSGEAKHEQIAALAEQIWREEGTPEGKAEEHWRRAEELLRRGQEPNRGKEDREQLASSDDRSASSGEDLS